MSGYLALFDMDKTLVNVNTAERYVRWRQRHGKNSTADVLRVAFWLVQYKFGFLDAPRIAERVMQQFRDTREDELRSDYAAWYEAEGLRYVVADARRTVEHHRAAGAELAIVTSSPRYAAATLAQELQIPHLLCSELEVDAAGCFTGRILVLCYGQGKVLRAAQWATSLDLSLEHAYFYTDSITDAPLLEVVGHPVVVNPDPRLKRLASARGWRLEHWRS